MSEQEIQFKESLLPKSKSSPVTENMTAWQKVNKVFEESEKLRILEELYMERGNVTSEQARKWALEKFEEKVIEA